MSPKSPRYVYILAQRGMNDNRSNILGNHDMNCYPLCMAVVFIIYLPPNNTSIHTAHVTIKSDYISIYHGSMGIVMDFINEGSNCSIDSHLVQDVCYIRNDYLAMQN